MNKGQLAARLLATFLGELQEQVRTMNADLLALESDPQAAAHLQSLFRVAHTLKGAARAVGVPLVEQTCHELEALLAQVRGGKRALGRDEFTLLFAAADALADAGQRLEAGRDLADSPLTGLRDALRGIKPRPASAAAPGPATTSAQPPPDRGDSHVRVAGEQLDAALASAGRLLIAETRVASRPAELAALHDLATRCATEWRRASRGVRVALNRSGERTALLQTLTTLDEHVRRIVQETSRLAGSAAADARALTQVTGEVVDCVRSLRMRSFAEACEALPRTVRDIAATAGKEVRLEVGGGDVQVDRAVLDGLREAILHLVRNAVDHGIEMPAAREQAGKPRAGTVTVAAAVRGDRILVTVADDGAGLDVPAIRRQLERRGVAAPTGERDLARALFAAGISTRTETTVISGRGVGLDVVRAAISRIRGSVDASWTAGAGTTFRLECPPTLATIRAVLVAVGPQIVAVPTVHVGRLMRVRPDAIKHAEGRQVIATAHGPVPLVALARLLPPLVERPAATPVSVLTLTDGERHVAVAVDELLAEQEVVLRPVRLGQRPLPQVSGAALLGSGRIALVLDPVATIASALGLGAASGLTLAEPTLAGPAKRRVLVVDDSITTRTLEKSILEAAGYSVCTAVDGVAGWKVLQDEGADLVVADVEMPGMDGFALCEAIRASKRFQALPVVLVTALETPEHHARGLEVGADAYLGKSSFDQRDLLDTVRQLLGYDGR